MNHGGRLSRTTLRCDGSAQDDCPESGVITLADDVIE
jgi:hypothetical protein